MFSGGFKVPQEVIDKQLKRKSKSGKKGTGPEIDFEEQKQHILMDLDLSLPGGPNDKRKQTMFLYFCNVFLERKIKVI